MKRIIIILSMIVLSVLLVGCDTAEERARTKKAKIQGEANAIQYIKEKYGFEAEVLSVEEERVSNVIVTEPTEDIFVKMAYKGQEFTVYIYGGTETTDGYDNYQLTEISKAIEKLIENETGMKPYALGFAYGVYEGALNTQSDVAGLTQIYYDGSNLKNILTENWFICIAEYIQGPDLKVLSEKDILRQYRDKMEVLLVNYESIENYNLVTTHTYNITGSPSSNDLYKNAVYIKEALELWNDSYYYDLAVKESEGIKYLPMGKDEDITATFKQVEQKLENNKWNERDDFKVISDTYEIITDASTLYIYIPKELLRESIKVENLSIGYDYDYKGEIGYQFNYMGYNEVGNYYVDLIYSSDEYNWRKFTLLEETR